MVTAGEGVREQTVALTADDGFGFSAFQAVPAAADSPGLVILQEIFGLTDQLKSVVRAYARDGYNTICPCLFDRVAPGTVVPFSDPNRGRDLAYGLPLDRTMRDIAATVAHVRGPRGVSVLGFCWGGGVIVRAAAELDLRGAIAFYGTRLQNYLECRPQSPLLFHFGATDPNSPPETIAAVRAAFPDAETYVYEAGHAFANDVRPSYNAEATETARQRTLAFLQRVHA